MWIEATLTYTPSNRKASVHEGSKHIETDHLQRAPEFGEGNEFEMAVHLVQLVAPAGASGAASSSAASAAAPARASTAPPAARRSALSKPKGFVSPLVRARCAALWAHCG